ncbi:MAG: EamA family transporter [Acidobacteria bacterium]|nr:EamA family transporter [Acidobacteriota bacterium]
MIGRTAATRLAVAHASVWLIWGSTYYGVRVLVQTVPPFFSMGSRFLIAGIAVMVWLRVMRKEHPLTGEQWRVAAIGGLMLVAAGNGAVAYTEQTVPSNLVALTVALMPAWMVLFDRIINGVVPPRSAMIALAVGFGGVAVLMGPSNLGAGEIPVVGALTVTAGSMSWALGSILTRGQPRPRSVMLGTAAQMIWGGVALIVLSGVVGEWSRLDASMINNETVTTWLYLVIAGSIIAYSAYVYLLHNTVPAKAGSYAFVNPIIAVIVGAGLGGEPLSPRVGIAAVMIVGAVALIVRYRQ